MEKVIIFAFFILELTLFSQTQNCLDFSNDLVVIDHDTSLNLGTNDITIEAWIKTSANVPENYWPVIVGKESSGTRQGFDLFIAHNSNMIAFQVFVNNTWFGVWGEVVNDGKWHHVVGRRTGNRIYTFKDGNQSGGWVQTGCNGNVNNNYPMVIGRGSWGNGYFDGTIDEVRVWNRSLSNDELDDLMFTKLEGSESDLKAYYQFDEVSGTTLPDLTSNNNNGTFQGSPVWTASYAPIASDLLGNMKNIRAVWNAKPSHTSSIVTLSCTISGNERIIFGHNDDLLEFTSENVPDEIESRLSRVWRLEVYGDTLIGNIIFDCSGFDFRNENYRLLVDNDGDLTDAQVIEGTFVNPTFDVTDHEFLHTFYYTIGVAQSPLPIPEDVIVEVSNDSVLISWAPVTEANSYSVYSCNEPNAAPSTWNLEQSGITEINWVDDTSEMKKFYYVKAVN